MEREDKKIRLLLVDDEDGFRQTIAKRLSKRTLEPLQASSGYGCLAIMDQEPVDVVVMDVKMPGLSGIDTLKAIRQSNARTQVILLTGNAAVSDGIEGIKAGAFDYLTKPVEIEHLVNKIRQAFEKILMEEEKDREHEYCKKLEKKMIDTDRLVALGTMATGIAHEINNPLAIINEAAGLMKLVINGPEMSGFPEKNILKLCVEKIEKSVNRAKRITHQLLGHVKKTESRASEFDLKELLSETLELVKKEIEYKQIVVHWPAVSKSAVITSDPYKIRQVLINLLNNAVHAMENKGSLTLSVWDTDSDAFLEIKDNGAGISKENLGKIFDPFFTTKSFDNGTGLGLFVVHKLISDLNGDIRVESTVGSGSSFVIRLPKNSDIKE